MPKNPAISVIVPVYNVEPYLEVALDSVLEQSFEDWEMLLVDDGSTDASGEICDRYGAKDERIRVIHQENKGLSGARNTALDVARGDYYTMLDSDDFFATKDYLKIMYHAAVDNDAEISWCALVGFSDGDPLPQMEGDPTEIKLVTGREAFLYGPYRSGQFHNSAFCKLYKRELFEGIRYPLGKYCEDAAVAHRLIYPAKKVASIMANMYGYRGRPSSIMGNITTKFLSDMTDAYVDRYRYFHDEIKDMDLALAALRIYRAQLDYLGKKHRLN